MLKKTIFTLVVILFNGPPFLLGQIKQKVAFLNNYSIENVILEDGKTYSRIILPDIDNRTDSVGYPNMPIKYIRFIIPSNSSASKIIVNKINTVRIGLDNYLEPTQPRIPTQINYKKPVFTGPKSKIYESNLPFPQSVFEIVDQGHFRGNRIVTVAVYPFQYFPDKNELIFYSSTDISLEFSIDKEIRSNSMKIPKKFMDDNAILKCMVENKSDVETYRVKPSNELTNSANKGYSSAAMKSTTTGIPISCDYVIVTSSTLAPEFTEFIAWKRRKGINIDLVTIEDIIANYEGDYASGIYDDAGKLRQFLCEAFVSGGLSYALLAGDYTVIPIRYGSWLDNTWTWDVNNPDDAKIPTDLYFSDFNGDWDVDNDIYLGEPQDDVDFYSEIYVGRLLCSTETDVRNWIQKVIKYEQNPGDGNYSYLRKAFYTQSDEMQSLNEAQEMANDFSTIFNNNTVWSELYNGIPDYNSAGVPESPTGISVISEMNNNYGLVSWFAHGGPSSIGVATLGNSTYGYQYKRAIFGMDSWDEDPSHVYSVIPENGNGLDKLTNFNFPSIAYTIACTTMPFDDYTHVSSMRNVGEGFTVLTKAGGPAYLGNTRYGWTYSSLNLFKEFSDVFVEGTSFKLGIAEATSKEVYFDRYLRFSNNLIGCPETELWTNIPSLFSNVTITENGTDVYVNVGVEGSKVCIMSAEDNGVSYHETKEVAWETSYTFNNVPDPYIVTITKHNYIPYIKNPDNVYIQNESIYTEKYIYGKHFFAGTNVTPTKPQGPAIVKTGSNVVFDAENDISLEAGFEVEIGSIFEAK